MSDSGWKPGDQGQVLIEELRDLRREIEAFNWDAGESGEAERAKVEETFESCVHNAAYMLAIENVPEFKDALSEEERETLRVDGYELIESVRDMHENLAWLRSVVPGFRKSEEEGGDA